MSGHGGGGGGFHFKELFTWDELMRDGVILLGIFVLMYVGSNITPITLSTIFSGEALKNIWAFFSGTEKTEEAVAFFWSLKALFALVAVLGFAFVIWIGPKMHKVHHKEEELYAVIKEVEHTEKEHATQWQVILDHVASENPAEWKMAVLEADALLDLILSEQGYPGQSLGEMLKSLEAASLPSYQDAWDAHKIRNEIAHEGASAEISKKMARDAITGFGKVFKDLGVI